jgi:hypothetical protein
MSKYGGYWLTDPWAHQMQLEERRWEEEVQKDYEKWLDSLGPWWIQYDQDIEDNKCLPET